MRAVMRIVVCAAILLPLTGCGSEGGGVAVTGKVTFEGQPIEEGSIQFVPQTGTEGPSAGASIKEGTYSIPRESGPVPGSYRVEINAYRTVRPKTAKEMQPMLFGQEAPPGVVQTEAIKENIIPKRYNVASDLTAKVPQQSSVVLDYSLTK
jgi:hypothetical protein